LSYERTPRVECPRAE